MRWRKRCLGIDETGRNVYGMSVMQVALATTSTPSAALSRAAMVLMEVLPGRFFKVHEVPSSGNSES